MVFLALGAVVGPQVSPVRQTAIDAIGAVDAAAEGSSLPDAQALFYNGRYDLAATLALTLVRLNPDDLQPYELRSSALLFQIKRGVGEAIDKDKALKQCANCADLMAAFQHVNAEGLIQARAQLKKNPHDDNAQFVLGKLDLNHVWLHLGTLGRRTGWNEYWEARHSLDAVLERNPRHVRARLARAWIDYIVDTRMTWATRWILGGGNKKKALAVMREAANADEDFYATVEARFALWDVLVREKNFGEALATARQLAEDFPRNAELTKFIDKQSQAVTPK